MIDRSRMLVQVAEWKAYPWLRHGFSTRFGGVSTVYRQFQNGGSAEADASTGDLNLGWTKDDDPANVVENRRRLVAAVGNPIGEAESVSEAPALITARQVHSAVSLVVGGSDAQSVSDFVNLEGRAVLEADGLMTSATGVLLGIQTADCVPVFVVDTRLRAVANFHAGWRGTAARVVEVGVAKMMAEFGSRPEELVAAIGPSIGACCYSVGDEVFEAFTSGFAYGEALFSRGADAGSAAHLNLWEANRRQLLDCGILAGRISVVGECTGCAGLPGQSRYFSHRCEKGFTGRMMSVVGVAPSQV